APGNTVVIAGGEPDAGRDWVPNCPVLWLGERRAFHERVGRRLLNWMYGRDEIERFIRRCRVTSALIEYLPLALEWGHACRACGVRTVVHGHGWDISAKAIESSKRMYRTLSDHAHIVVPSSVSRQHLIRANLPEERVHLVPYGVAVESTPKPTVSSHSNRIVRCLAVGRLVGKKSPIYLLESF